MKSIFCFISCLIIAQFSDAQNLEWAANIGNSNSIAIDDVEVGASGCSYYSGFFNGALDFDPGSGVSILNGTSYDAFILKLDPSGNFIWVKRLCSTGHIKIDLALDTYENIFVAGNFINSSDFDPGVGVYNLTSNGSTDIFVMKLDSSGSFGWAKQIGSTGLDYIAGIAIDNWNDLCITGNFVGTVDFDPGPGVNNLTGGDDIFALKIDSSGNFKWCKKLSTGGLDNSSYRIATDANSNMFISGLLNSVHTIFKLDSSGAALWAKQIVGTSGGHIQVTTDHLGNLYAYGHFTFPADFDFGPGVFTLTPQMWGSNYVLKTDNSGNFIWAREISVSPGNATDIKVDMNGSVYYTGTFAYGMDLDPGPGTNIVISEPTPRADCFLVKLSSNADLLFGIRMGSDGDDGGSALALGSNGELFLTGRFQNTVDFDPGSGIYNLTASNQTSPYYDAFFLKLSSTLGVSEVNRQEPSVTIYPNPATGSFYVNSSVTISALQVTDMLGRIVYSAAPGKEQCAVTVSASPGIYQVIIYSGENKVVKKLVLE